MRRLQAATGLGMQLQKPARTDLRAGGVGLEGCSLYHAQARPCQPSFASQRVGRTPIGARNWHQHGLGVNKYKAAAKKILLYGKSDDLEVDASHLDSRGPILEARIVLGD